MAWMRQINAGAMSGLTAAVVALSSGALIFDQSLPHAQGAAMAMMLITAVVGSLYGGFFKGDPTIVASVEPGVVSVIATALVFKSAGPEGLLTHQGIWVLLLITGLTGLSLWAFAHFKLGHLVRYLPFPVMAGFMASTGWLIASGALDIASGVPLNLRGLRHFLDDPVRPELLVTLLGAALLMFFVRRDRRGFGMPAVFVLLFVGVHAMLWSGILEGVGLSSHERWLFSRIDAVQWLPPIFLDPKALRALPLSGMLSVFPIVLILVVMNILINFASLEVSFSREYDLDQALRNHAKLTLASGCLGGFVPVLSVSRTGLSQVMGGKRLAGLVASVLCLAVLMGASDLVGSIPRAALGAVTLYLGLHLIEDWLIRQYRRLAAHEFIQILLMTALVAFFGFVPGFVAGVVLACVMFVRTYSQAPLYTEMGDLRTHRSSVLRSEAHADYLRQEGEGVRLYRLQGYLFFGSFYRFDERMRNAPVSSLSVVLIDFTRVLGVDASAKAALQRILRRYDKAETLWIFVYNDRTRGMLEDLAREPTLSDRVFFLPTLDRALEMAEDRLLLNFPTPGLSVEQACFGWLQDPLLIERFMSYCHIRKVEKGEDLCLEGEMPEEIYFVGSGALEVVRQTPQGEVRLAKVYRGAMVGETAFFSGAPRNASIRASSEAQIFFLRSDDFERLRADRPKLGNRFDHYLIKKLSHALMQNNEWLAEWMAE